jgi:hypothetical protein
MDVAKEEVNKLTKSDILLSGVGLMTSIEMNLGRA